MSLLSAQMVEVIANFAFILGTKFKARLIDVFYILIELTVDQNADVIVRQASASTLRRIAIYLEYDDVYSMLKDNLDYVVDNTCVQLRNSVTLSYMHTHSSRYNYRSALVVDAVFGAFGCSLFTSSNELNESKAQASFSMLKDMILDTLDILHNLNINLNDDNFNFVFRLNLDDNDDDDDDDDDETDSNMASADITRTIFMKDGQISSSNFNDKKLPHK